MSAPAFLLAAGLGTRLRPLTLDRPKPLVPLCGLPILDQAVALLRRHEIDSAVVNAFHLPEAIERWADSQEIEIKVSVEAPEILGTGGGLKRAGPDLAEDFVVLNGDVVSSVDLGLMLSSLDTLPEGPRAFLALRSPEPEQAYSRVEVDSEGRVVNLAGLASSSPVGEIFEGTHFTGVHAMNAAALALLPSEGSPCVVRNLYADMVSGRRLGGFVHPGLWLELGRPQDYLEANLALLRKQVITPLDPHAHSAGSEACEIHPSAQVHPGTWLGEGVSIGPQVQVGEGVILGAGSVLSSGARIRESVVWDGCTVPKEARFERVVVHDSGVLRVPRTSTQSLS